MNLLNALTIMDEVVKTSFTDTFLFNNWKPILYVVLMLITFHFTVSSSPKYNDKVSIICPSYKYSSEDSNKMLYEFIIHNTSTLPITIDSIWMIFKDGKKSYYFYENLPLTEFISSSQGYTSVLPVTIQPSETYRGNFVFEIQNSVIPKRIKLKTNQGTINTGIIVSDEANGQI